MPTFIRSVVTKRLPESKCKQFVRKHKECFTFALFESYNYNFPFENEEFILKNKTKHQHIYICVHVCAYTRTYTHKFTQVFTYRNTSRKIIIHTLRVILSSCVIVHLMFCQLLFSEYCLCYGKKSVLRLIFIPFKNNSQYCLNHFFL